MKTATDAFRLCLGIGHGMLLAMAAIYGGIAAVRGSPVTAELYGPAIHAIPAIVWAAGQIGGAFLCIAGALIWGRIGQVLLLTGAAVSGVFYGALASLASYVAEGLIAQAGALGVGLPTAAVTFIFAVGAMRSGRKA